MNFTGGQSRGVPVGPTASVVFSEACLTDVDLFLVRKGYVHTRYVDDFRIFCGDATVAWRALHDLTEYLYTAHRLTLQSSKTQMLDVSDFVEKELIDPQHAEAATVDEKMVLLAEQASVYGEPGEDVDQYPDEVVRKNLLELFEAALVGDGPHLCLCKYLLRRGASLRSGVIRKAIFENFDKLLPIFREVALYFMATTNNAVAPIVATRLLAAFKACEQSHLKFTKEWIAELLMNRLQEISYDEVEQFVGQNASVLGVLRQALLARKLKQVDWVRERKETWQNNSPWERRAIIWSSLALSKDEMNFWLKRVQNAGDILDSSIAEAALLVGNAA